MRSRPTAAVAALTLSLSAFAAHAQEAAPPPPPNASPPSPPLPGAPPPALSARPPDPLLSPSAPAPLARPSASPAPRPQPRPRWVTPVEAVLIVGAVGFAAASIAVISTGPTSDQARVNLGAGLGAGFIGCALGGVIIGFVVH